MSIPESIKLQLWGKTGGRCQYRGCNKPLWVDPLTKCEFNIAYIAHIVASKPSGPRGDKERSKALRNDISNLMILCDEHHRLIDKGNVEGHSVERLKEMKQEHEERIERLTSITSNLQSHVVIYGSNMGEQSSQVFSGVHEAMLPYRYPAESRPIELGIISSPFQDNEESFWKYELENLQRKFNDYLKPRISRGEIKHLSVFALAPQPLLVKLGQLLSDIPAADVYQIHREPPDWKWQEGPEDFSYITQKPENFGSNVALNLSLSASINNSRILRVLGNDSSVWKMTIEVPNNDFLKSNNQLRLFRQELRRLMDEIKSHHPSSQALHIFPAVPVAIAIEIGRVWMPKADLPVILYDENRELGGFVRIPDI